MIEIIYGEYVESLTFSKSDLKAYEQYTDLAVRPSVMEMGTGEERHK